MEATYTSRDPKNQSGSDIEALSLHELFSDVDQGLPCRQNRRKGDTAYYRQHASGNSGQYLGTKDM